MRLGIISDTHNVLRQEVMDQLSTCDFILHAGDFCKEEILNQLQAIGKVYAVKAIMTKVNGQKLCQSN